MSLLGSGGPLAESVLPGLVVFKGMDVFKGMGLSGTSDSSAAAQNQLSVRTCVLAGSSEMGHVAALSSAAPDGLTPLQYRVTKVGHPELLIHLPFAHTCTLLNAISRWLDHPPWAVLRT